MAKGIAASIEDLDWFLASLQARPSRSNVTNPWVTSVPGVDAVDAPQIRLGHLRAYLAPRLYSAELLLVAEAPGYQGCRFSGIAMTCERTLLNRKKGIPAQGVFSGPKQRTSATTVSGKASVRRYGFCEPTATVVWQTLLGLGIKADKFVLWNVFPFHPHEPGQPLSNRTPTAAEVESESQVLLDFVALFPRCRVVAVGETAGKRLHRHDLSIPVVRHPANGGVPDFQAGLTRLVTARPPPIHP